MTELGAVDAVQTQNGLRAQTSASTGKMVRQWSVLVRMVRQWSVLVRQWSVLVRMDKQSSSGSSRKMDKAMVSFGKNPTQLLEASTRLHSEPVKEFRSASPVKNCTRCWGVDPTALA